MTIKIEKAGTVAIDEKGSVSLIGWEFDGGEKPYVLSDYGLAALEYVIDRYKKDNARTITDGGGNELNGVKGSLPDSFLK